MKREFQLVLDRWEIDRGARSINNTKARLLAIATGTIPPFSVMFEGPTSLYEMLGKHHAQLVAPARFKMTIEPVLTAEELGDRIKRAPDTALAEIDAVLRKHETNP